MTKKTKKHVVRKCVQCGSILELYEIDFEKRRKILMCKKCGLFHFYKRTFFGKWKLVKAGKVSDLWDKK